MKSLNFGAEKIAVVSLKNNFINLGSDVHKCLKCLLLESIRMNLRSASYPEDL